MSRLRSGSRTTFSASSTRFGSTCMDSRIAYTPRPMARTSPNRSVMIVLAYLWLLAFVPLLVEERDADIRWHAKHGLVLTAAELAAIFLYLTLTSLVSVAALALGVVMAMFLVFAWVGILAIHVVAILKGVNGGPGGLPARRAHPPTWSNTP